MNPMVGFEYEFTPGSRDFERDECVCSDEYLDEFGCECGADYIDEDSFGGDWPDLVHGFEYGEDSPHIEYRSAGPRPFDAGVSEAVQFTRWLARHGDYELDSECGFHVHLNCDPDQGPAVDPDALWWAYNEMRDEFYRLTVNPRRRNGFYCKEVGEPSERWFVDFSTRHLDPDSYGTVELRGWDATDSPDLMQQRMLFLAKLVARAHTLEVTR